MSDKRVAEKLTMPQMTPARDEVASRQGGAKTKNSRNTGQANHGSSSGAGGGFIAVLAFLVALVAVGGCYFLWTQNQTLLADLQQADTRLQRLEAQLASTGDELTQSDAAVRVQLKEVNSEVAKLWDARKVSNKQLKTHETNIRNLTARSDKLLKTSKANAQQITAQAAALDDIDQALDGLDAESIIKQFERLTIGQSSQKKQIDALTIKTQENQEWLESINEFRRQVNQRLNAIQNPAASTPSLQ